MAVTMCHVCYRYFPDSNSQAVHLGHHPGRTSAQTTAATTAATALLAAASAASVTIPAHSVPTGRGGDVATVANTVLMQDTARALKKLKPNLDDATIEAYIEAQMLSDGKTFS